MPSITRYIRRYSARFVQHRGGSVAVYTALTMLVMVAAVGIGIDTARAFLLKSKLSQALDAAALAGGKSFVIADSNADINMFFNANFPSGYLGSTVSGPTITQNTANQTITVAATATANTIFGALLGMKTVTVAASSIATRTLTALDVALSIDVSQSMTEKISGSSQSKLAQVQSAATQLVTTLFGGASDAKTITVDGTLYHLLNIGLVTFNSK
ncbi:MAG: pilus assembly protein TadG-related protein, partial [Dongiaceae bacterium]